MTTTLATAPVPSVPVSLRLPAEVHQQPSAPPVQPQVAVMPAEQATWMATSTGAAVQIVDQIAEEYDGEDTEILQSSLDEEEATPTVPRAAEVLGTETNSPKESLAGSPRVQKQKKRRASRKEHSSSTNRQTGEGDSNIEVDEFRSPVVKRSKIITGKDMRTI